jgi:hypothetical protein
MVVIMVMLQRIVASTPNYGDTVEESRQDPYLSIVVIMVTL